MAHELGTIFISPKTRPASFFWAGKLLCSGLPSYQASPLLT